MRRSIVPWKRWRRLISHWPSWWYKLLQQNSTLKPSALARHIWTTQSRSPRDATWRAMTKSYGTNAFPTQWTWTLLLPYHFGKNLDQCWAEKKHEQNHDLHEPLKAPELANNVVQTPAHDVSDPLSDGMYVQQCSNRRQMFSGRTLAHSNKSHSNLVNPCRSVVVVHLQIYNIFKLYLFICLFFCSFKEKKPPIYQCNVLISCC